MLIWNGEVEFDHDMLDKGFNGSISLGQKGFSDAMMRNKKGLSEILDM